MLVRVSKRSELARVRVIGTRLYGQLSPCGHPTKLLRTLPIKDKIQIPGERVLVMFWKFSNCTRLKACAINFENFQKITRTY